MKISGKLFHKRSFCNVFILVIMIFGKNLQSSVAMQLRCGGIFTNNLVSNCPQNVPAKEF